MNVRKSIAILFLAAAFALVALLLCAVFPFGEANAVSAAELPSFIISTDDGQNWTLSLDGETVAVFSGKFSDPPFSDVASVVFESKIKGILAERGQDDYFLSFVLPSIDKEVVGSTSFEYTLQSGGGFTVKGIYEPVISSDVTQQLQYAVADGEFETYNDSAETDGGLTFGANVDTGRYSVRVAVFERFVFDGKMYRAARYSSSVECTVVKAVPQTPTVDDVSIVYGTAASEIAGRINLADGSLRLSVNQSNPLFSDENALPDVNEDGYVVNFDYLPYNQNYEILRDVGVKVKVEPLALRIYIGDSFSVVGEPIDADVPYEIVTPMVGSDTAEDLGVKLYVDGADKDRAGTYMILATFENGNYTPDCRNLGNAFLFGGIHTVYQTRLSAVAPDGVEFAVYIAEGFEDLNFSVSFADGEITEYITVANQDYKVLSAYALIFENADGERVILENGFLLTVSGFKDATHICTEGGAVETDESGTPFKTRASVVYLCVKADNVLSETSAVVRASIALIALSCVLGVVFIILTVAYSTRRRYFR